MMGTQTKQVGKEGDIGFANAIFVNFRYLYIGYMTKGGLGLNNGGK